MKPIRRGCMRWFVSVSKDEGCAEGLAEGLVKGLAEGLAEGLARWCRCFNCGAQSSAGRIPRQYLDGARPQSQYPGILWS